MDKSKLVHIKVYATNIQFLVNNDYELENGLRLDEFMKSLTEYKFNYIVKGWLPINKYILHNRTTGHLIVPRFYLKELVDYIQYNNFRLSESSINSIFDLKFTNISFERSEKV